MGSVCVWLMKVGLNWLCVCIVLSATAGEVLHYKWEVEYTHWSPDGVEGVVIAINGQFPGPTIRARAGDTINVELVNKLHTEGVVIHWHGITQRGTPWADGTASVSQCAINPGETFLYTFKVDRAGTYFYHGHYGMQRSAGLYGMLIVDVAVGKKEKFQYDGEFDLLLSDWWHKDSHEQEVDLFSKPLRWIGESQTLLINGRGQFNCSLAAHFSNSSAVPCKITGGEQYAPYILHVHPNKTYRLRIACSTALASLNFAIGSHKMRVVEADGNYVEPFEVENMDIYSGESYSVLFSTKQPPSENYWISMSVRGREPRTPQGLTILNYLPSPALLLPTSPPPLAPQWNDYNYSKTFLNKIHAAAGSPPPPTKQHRRIVLLSTQNSIDGFTKWAINSISLSLPDNYTAASRNATSGSGVYMLRFGSTVDVILQNAVAANVSESDIHPWHLHGHDFWVLGYGEGKFVDKDERKFDLKKAPLRNTAVVLRNGWTALRFVADNPGVWPFHCHIEPHLHMGMGVVFAEGVHRLKTIPNEVLACGLTAKYLMRKSN